jgi:hypothetical protein
MYVQEKNDATLWLVTGTLYHQIKKYATEKCTSFTIMQ